MLNNLDKKIKDAIKEYKKEFDFKTTNKDEEKILETFFKKQIYIKDIYTKLMKDVGHKYISYKPNSNTPELHYLIDHTTNQDKQIMLVSKLNQQCTSLTTFMVPPELIPYIKIYKEDKKKFRELLTKAQFNLREEMLHSPKLQEVIDRKQLLYSQIKDGIIYQPQWAGFGTILSITCSKTTITLHTMSEYNEEFLKINSIFYSLDNHMYYDNESLLLAPPVVNYVVEEYDKFIKKHQDLKGEDNKTLDLKGELQIIQTQLHILEQRKKQIEKQLLDSKSSKKV